MKFLHFKEALEGALKVEPAPPVVQQQPNPIPFYGIKSSAVIRDKTSREPIDKLAAIVTSKCPWWAKLIDYGKTPTPKVQQQSGKISGTSNKPNHPKPDQVHRNRSNGTRKASGKKAKKAKVAQTSPETPTQHSPFTRDEILSMLLMGAITSNEYELLLEELSE